MLLNILFLVCSLPIFTIGASFTAMYYVTLKLAENEEGYIARGFLKSFKQNFKQATIIWLILLFFGIVLVLDLLCDRPARSHHRNDDYIRPDPALRVPDSCTLLQLCKGYL